MGKLSVKPQPVTPLNLNSSTIILFLLVHTIGYFTVAGHVGLLLAAKPYEEMYEFCDFSLVDQVSPPYFEVPNSMTR